MKTFKKRVKILYDFMPKAVDGAADGCQIKTLTVKGQVQNDIECPTELLGRLTD